MPRQIHVYQQTDRQTYQQTDMVDPMNPTYSPPPKEKKIISWGYNNGSGEKILNVYRENER